MEYSEELSSKIVASSWQCTNCKTCSICLRPDPSEDEQMLFCDACDLGYHMPCHRPPVRAKPTGKWVCYKCSSNNKVPNGVPYHYSLDGDLSGYMPAPLTTQAVAPRLPLPQLHPAQPGGAAAPANWEEFPVDPTVPDVTEWAPQQITAYFSAQGFPRHLAEVFQKEVRRLN